ncbi:RNA repair transcriptional activator RtcR family protein [Sorangium sp. So ce295]|uniref:RNA repair transcriptional activator RtcR family protein n=1 Tax=Sorangium sp. So ce295 TaxID=3133295 RepID=UPI003F62C35F
MQRTGLYRFIHVTTGTHVAQIYLFFFTESRYSPGRRIQTSPSKRDREELAAGSFTIIDLDLSKYDRIASRLRSPRVTEDPLCDPVPSEERRYTPTLPMHPGRRPPSTACAPG